MSLSTSEVNPQKFASINTLEGSQDKLSQSVFRELDNKCIVKSKKQNTVILSAKSEIRNLSTQLELSTPTRDSLPDSLIVPDIFLSNRSSNHCSIITSSESGNRMIKANVHKFFFAISLFCYYVSLMVLSCFKEVASVTGTNDLDEEMDHTSNITESFLLNPLARPFVPRDCDMLWECPGSSNGMSNTELPQDCLNISDAPFLQDLPTPMKTQTENLSINVDPLVTPPMCILNPMANPFIPFQDQHSEFFLSSLNSTLQSNEMSDNPTEILSELKEKNSERPIIAHLNINSISSKFEPLTSLIKDTVDLMVVTESKLDDTFPLGQFQIDGFAKPIRLDRNKHGGGLIVFIRDGLTCHELKPRTLYPDLECTFLEMRIRQSKWLVVVGYNPHKKNIGSFLKKLSNEIDQYLPKYENIIMLSDRNSAIAEKQMKEFLEMYILYNLFIHRSYAI